MPDRLLAGYTILEAADPLTEFAGLMLAGLGADVFLLEPPGGASTRRRGPYAPGVSGGPSYDAGLYTMLAGALNLHHVVLDSVIWKLRNARIASILIRGDAPPAAARAGRSLVPKLVFASGALGVVLMLASIVESDVVLTAAVKRDDTREVERQVKARLGIRCTVEAHAAGSLPRYEAKAVRVLVRQAS